MSISDASLNKDEHRVSSEVFHLTPLTIYVIALHHYCAKLDELPILEIRGFRQFNIAYG